MLYNVIFGTVASPKDLALLLLHSMPGPNVISYSASITACEKGAMWQEALSLFHQMQHVAISPNLHSYNSTISSCEKATQWQKALVIFASAVSPDVVPWQGEGSRARNLKPAILLWKSLKRSPYTKVTFSAIISACEKGTQWQSALHLLQDWRKKADLVGFNMSLNMLLANALPALAHADMLKSL